MYLFKVIRSGVYKPAGTIDIPFLGAPVGALESWVLTRRGDIGPDAGLYDLRAVLSFLTDVLWEDDEFPKRILLNLSPRKQYRVQQAPDYATVREGRTLLMEGVTIHESGKDGTRTDT